jgi:hypothetical protein
VAPEEPELVIFSKLRGDRDGLECPNARVHAVDGGVAFQELQGGPVGGLVALPAFWGEDHGKAAARHHRDGLRGKALPVEDHCRARGGYFRLLSSRTS